MFAWMRPNDLIWNYWVNNYLLGNQPPAFDILYWNADTTRLPARLHGDYLDLYFTNPFVNSGKLSLNGKAIDMSKVKADSYVVAGVTDHITPLEGRSQDGSDHGRGHDFRAVEQRPPAKPAQSTDKPEGVLCNRASQSRRARCVPHYRRETERKLVARLAGLAACALGRGDRRARFSRQRAVSGDSQGAGDLRL